MNDPTLSAKHRMFSELKEYARSKGTESLRSQFAPPPPLEESQPVPGAEDFEGEQPPDELELDDETLTAIAGE